MTTYHSSDDAQDVGTIIRRVFVHIQRSNRKKAKSTLQERICPLGFEIISSWNLWQSRNKHGSSFCFQKHSRETFKNSRKNYFHFSSCETFFAFWGKNRNFKRKHWRGVLSLLNFHIIIWMIWRTILNFLWFPRHFDRGQEFYQIFVDNRANQLQWRKNVRNFFLRKSWILTFLFVTEKKTIE